MNKVNQMIKNKLEKLQSDYGECKIDKNEFIAGITALGFTSPMDIDMLYDEACEGRYQYKLEKGKALQEAEALNPENKYVLKDGKIEIVYANKPKESND